jgi:hypothetical protein
MAEAMVVSGSSNIWLYRIVDMQLDPRKYGRYSTSTMTSDSVSTHGRCVVFAKLFCAKLNRSHR